MPTLDGGETNDGCDGQRRNRLHDISFDDTGDVVAARPRRASRRLPLLAGGCNEYFEHDHRPGPALDGDLANLPGRHVNRQPPPWSPR